MNETPEDSPDIPSDDSLDEQTSAEERFQRAIRGFGKPIGGKQRRPLKAITSDEHRERLFLTQQCVNLGMSVEQMVDFLPTWGVPASRSWVYEQLPRLKLPRYYGTTEARQTHHDYYTFRFFIRIAQDAHGFRTAKLAKGTAPCDAARFRPDFKFQIRHYLYFMEMQLSDLTETRWSVKFRNYLRLREMIGMPFRALFIIDQKGDLAYARRFARQLVEKKPTHLQDLFLFLPLNDLKSSKNVALDPVWWTPSGKKVPLLQYLTKGV